MARPGPRTTYRYTEKVKATAVRLSQLSGVSVQDVAASLYIHPFMLSLWRKQAREGLIVTKGVEVDKEIAAELKELRKIKKAHERLKIEHDLLKKRSPSLPLEERNLRLHQALSRDVPGENVVQTLWSEPGWLLRVAEAAVEPKVNGGLPAWGTNPPCPQSQP